MKKVSKSDEVVTTQPRRGAKRKAAPSELRAHYHFDYAKSRPNRFAGKLPENGAFAIVLAPDVAEVFDSAEAVNTFLRSAIAAMPHARDSRKKRRAS